MVKGALIQGGQIATGRRDSFDWKEWGNYVLNNGVIGGAINIGVGGLFKAGGDQFAKLAKAHGSLYCKWGKAVNWVATKFASRSPGTIAAAGDRTDDGG